MYLVNLNICLIVLHSFVFGHDVDLGDIDFKIDQVVCSKLDIDIKLPQSKLDKELQILHRLIIAAHTTLSEKRIHYFYTPKDKTAQDVKRALFDLENICDLAERTIGSNDYVFFLMQVHAYMKIKHYHNWLQNLINEQRVKSLINFDQEIKQASKTMMSMIYDAREKHSFDFYTAMEKDEKVKQ